MKKKVKKCKTDRYICFDTYIPLTDEQMKIFEEEINMSIRPKNKEHLKMKPLPDTRSFELDPASLKGFEDQFGGSDFLDECHETMGVEEMKKVMQNRLYGPIATPEQEKAINELYKQNPGLNNVAIPKSSHFNGSGLADGFNPKAPWIQTYTGRRFNPTCPNPEAIVIQDIAHALSMQCRFSGHCREFYSVAQHSVLVSHTCNFEDALWGLLHDASEAYLIDVPRPLKQSGKFQAYIDFETVMQKAVCQRFGLDEQEPSSVKRADKILLATEARDLMSPLHPDWRQPMEPLPFIIEPWEPARAKKEFLKRYSILISE
jgi:hypothetical protein